jgi:serine/threonine-protein kinase
VVKVSDMGLARIGYSGDGSESPKRLTGTADFIAPEQAIDSKTADARSDIYSLGCTWYFLLVGKPPYAGNNVMQRLAKHQTATVPLVSNARSDCPPAICSLIQRMMSKQPADRPTSAAELLTQLRRIAGSQPASGHLANRPHRESATLGAAEDSSSYGSIDEIVPLGDAVPTDTGDIDFGSLPPIDTSALQTSPLAASPATLPAARQASVSKQGRASSDSNEAKQSVLLGIGLALSIVALLMVVGATFYQMTKEERPAQRLKTMEDGKGNVIVVGQ